LAGAVLGATLVAAVWLYSYETWHTIEVFDRSGRVAASTRVKSQPWWSVYGALALAVAGTGFSLWLVPEGRRLMSRFVSRLTARFSAKPS
jgi:hypothetical protein